MFILYKKDVFESFNGKYLKIPIGKVLISIEEIIVEFAGGLIYMKKVIALSLLLVTLSACSVNSASDNIDFNQDYGHFYDLREEFHLGNISYDDLLNISYYNNDGIDLNCKLFDNFKVKDIGSIPSDINHEIKVSLANNLEEYNNLDLAYYGKYNDYYAIKVKDMTKTNISYRHIGGITLEYIENEIKLWRENKEESFPSVEDYGSFYNLEEIYETGKLSYNDLLNLEIKNMIKSSYANTIEEYNSLTIYYYGTYSDYYAIRIDSSLKSEASILVTKVIDDVNFVYSGRSIELFKLDN